MATVRFSAAAEADFVAIWEYAARDKPIAALELVDEIERKCDLVAESPNSCPLYRPDRNLRTAFHGRYVIYYRPSDEGIEIVRILSGEQDAENA